MLSKQRSPSQRKNILPVVLSLLCTLFAGSAAAQSGYGFAHPSGYGIKIYKAESVLYPFVQVYFRTFDENQMPLVNLN